MKNTFLKFKENNPTLTRDSRVVCLVHNDLDGIACAVAFKSYFENFKYIECKYQNIDSTIEQMKEINDEFDWLFIADISPSSLDILTGLNAIVLDHHESAAKIHNPEKNSFVYWNDNISGCLLTFKFLNTLFGKPKYDIYSLIEIANDYDLWHLKHPQSMNMNRLYFTLFGRRFFERFKYGFTSFTIEESKLLDDIEDRCRKTFDELDILELGKMVAITQGTEFISELCHRILEEMDYPVVIWRNTRHNQTSVRFNKNYNGCSCGVMLQELGLGGGHAKAGGFSFIDFEDFKMKCQMIQKYVEKNPF